MSFPIGLQLWSVKDACKADFVGTLRRVRAMGFDSVEFAGLYDQDPAELRRVMDGEGLACCGAHVGLAQLDDAQRGATLDAMVTLGCPAVIVPSLPVDRRDTKDKTRTTIAGLLAIMPAVESAGMKFGYHAHDFDFRPLENGSGREDTPWYLIARGTPATFAMQFDTSNALAGGDDGVTPLRELAGRGWTLHCKEWVKPDAGRGEPGGNGRACIGGGDVPWDAVLVAARGPAGTKQLVVEQEGHPTLDPLSAAERSLRGLRDLVGG
jgi:sugar phosphate isomerase/epimerase